MCHIKNIFICIALLVCTLARSQSVKDTLFFGNGSIIIGELKSIKLGVVTFDPDDANDITVQLRKLRTIAGRMKIFRIETVAHNLYFGFLIPDTAKNRVKIKTESDTISIDIENISVMYAFEKTVARRFSGSAGIGYSYTRSSGFGRFNFDATLRYTSRKTESAYITHLTQYLHQTVETVG